MNLFRQAGAALYGPRWQQPLADALGVNPRRVRAWAAGHEPPVGVWDDLLVLLEGNEQELERVQALIHERQAVEKAGAVLP